MSGNHKTEAQMKLIIDALPDAEGDLREALVDMLNLAAWDDAVHIAAPWETRSSLCGNWERNLVKLSDPRPNGVEGCWTCLQAADWFDQHQEWWKERIELIREQIRQGHASDWAIDSIRMLLAGEDPLPTFLRRD